MKNLEQANTKTESRLVVVRAGGREENGMRFPLGVVKMFGN